MNPHLELLIGKAYDGVLARVHRADLRTWKCVEEVLYAVAAVRPQFVDVRSPDEPDAAHTVAKAQSDGRVLSDEQLITVGDSPRRIADFALRHRLPSSDPTDYAQVGGLVGYGVDWTDVVRRSMAFVDKILKGAKPADLPIQQASKFDLVVNLKTAKALGLAIPPSLLQRADQVIE